MEGNPSRWPIVATALHSEHIPDKVARDMLARQHVCARVMSHTSSSSERFYLHVHSFRHRIKG
jgi:hypothetical protein